MMIHYVAALIDKYGAETAFSFDLTKKPNREEIHKVFSESTEKSFASRFPQLLLGANYWFPFERRLLIEEPDWRGKLARYGSIPRLAEEISEIKSLIREFSSKHQAELNLYVRADTLIGLAWQASSAIEQICSFASHYNIPMWITS